MKTAVISDIHGNLAALKAVLADIEEQQVPKIVCLGDSIGYGPQPEEVVAALRSREVISICGNHEAALWDNIVYAKMSEAARVSLQITRKLLSPDTVTYLRNLKHRYEYGNEWYIHGSPPNSFLTYFIFLPPGEQASIFRDNPFGIAFCGHTHLLRVTGYTGSLPVTEEPPKGIMALKPGSRYVVNVGSVGQPRDGNNCAKYVIYDSTELTLGFRYIPYPIAATVSLLRNLGFPEINAKRLLQPE